MVSPNKLVSVYLPEELYHSLITYQEQQGLEEASEAVVKILTQFLHKGGEAKRYATTEQLELLEGKVTYLSEQVALISQILARTAPTETGLTAFTGRNDNTRPPLTVQQPSVAFGSINIEEDYEEPDEILYDFLAAENSPSPSQLPAAAVGSIFLEEEDEEPDEILYDFLEPENPPSPSEQQ